MTAKTKALDDLLGALTVGGRLNPERSRAVESYKYGDPAKFVKFGSERGDMEDSIRTKEVESILRHELENWLRWGRKRDWMPVSFKCPLGFLYKSTDVHEGSYRALPYDESEAVKLERIIVSLPQKHRQAFVMHHLDRAAVFGMVRIVRGRDEKARLLSVAKSRYHELVGQAHNIILREWQKKC
jgi:hypothetical protein